MRVFWMFWGDGGTSLELLKHHWGNSKTGSCPLHMSCVIWSHAVEVKGIASAKQEVLFWPSGFGREFLNSNFLSVSSCNHNYQALLPLIPVPALTSVQNSEIPNILVWICVSTLVVGILFLFIFFFFSLRDLFLVFWSGAQHTPGSHTRRGSSFLLYTLLGSNYNFSGMRFSL